MATMAKPTTIQLDSTTKDALDGLKLHHRESYNEVILRLIEDLSELDDRTRRELEDAKRQVKRGRGSTHDDVGERVGL